jgi:hypothetical protein
MTKEPILSAKSLSRFGAHVLTQGRSLLSMLQAGFFFFSKKKIYKKI